MSGKGRGGDGIRPLGVRNGQRFYEIRLPYTDPKTGKRKDTRRTIQADSKHAAAKERLRLLDELKRGATGKSERKRFGEALAAYMETVPRASTRQAWKSYAKMYVLPKFGDHYLHALTRAEMQLYLDKLDAGKSTLEGVRCLLRGAFKLAVRRGWIDVSPARDLELPKRAAVAPAKEPKRALTPDEAVRFLADLREHRPLLYPVIATQYVLGCRFSEVTALAPEDVDLETGLVTIRRGQVQGAIGPTKASRPRLAAIPLSLRAELRSYRARVVSEGWKGHSELFFPRPPLFGIRRHDTWDMSTAIRWVRQSFTRLGYEMANATHAARHTMISLAAQERESELLLRKVVGHASTTQTLGYTTAHAADVVNLAERLAAKVAASGKESGKTGAGSDDGA